MAKLKKSELKNYLRHSIQALKHSLDYTAYCYFILAMSFSYHIYEMPDRYTIRPGARPLATDSPIKSPTISFQRKKRNIQDDVTEEFSILENLNPPLKGLLLPAIAKASIPDSALLAYRDHLDNLQQITGVFSAAEGFSHAYEYWISQLAKMTTRRGVAFYTQRPLVRLLVEITKPSEGMTIYDPTVGTGGMLIGCAQYIHQQGGTLDSTQFYGREKLPDIWAICRMNLMSHRIENTDIELGDTLQSSPAPLDTFDLVLQNLPLSPNPGNRIQTVSTNTAFLEHTIKSVSDSGRAAVLAPSEILLRDYQEIWRYVVGRDWLEAVISLPPSVLYGTSASASVLVFNKKKSVERLSQVLFIQFPSNFAGRSWHNELQNEDIQPVIKAFEDWGLGSDYARAIPISQIEEQNYSLRIGNYPDSGETPQPRSFDLVTALSQYRLAVQEREAAVERLMKTLEALPLPNKKL